MIHLQDILNLEQKKLRRITSSPNTNPVVRSITVLENLDVKSWLVGGEILLVSSGTLNISTNKLIELIKNLSLMKSCCLVIKKLDDNFKVKSEVENLASDIQYPIFILDDNSSYVQIMSEVNDLLFKDRDQDRLISLELNRLFYLNEIKDTDFDFVSHTINKDLYKLTVKVIKFSSTFTDSPLNKINLSSQHIEVIDKILKKHFIHSLKSIKYFFVDNSDNFYLIFFFDAQSISSFSFKDEIFKSIPRNFTYKFHIGESESHRASDLNISFKESNFAIKSLDFLPDSRIIVNFKDVYLLQLIISANKESEKSLLNLDLVNLLNNSVYLSTLKTFFNQNESIKKTAEKMFTHPNTIRYRLESINELTGLNYKNTNDKLILYVYTMTRLLTINS
ncbi:helix-turn-helix domain-containing protein [Lactobacillus sp. YT155]|uniref:helix-turn-helix domain-containing protein n=1 Tax=Lactobacillus sp. YT155 TaxID=3060955 RepID=UPI00265F5EEE|nr:PucR family transcriptional regulator [Lactobacillus sp. YT155]MDO1605742.1 helix-turn-helix domain-containing protein [Lactobacillus sp. YT155]